MANENVKLSPAAIIALARGDVENARIAATPGGIERQERVGQIAIVAGTNMPIKLLPGREAFEAVGFTFGQPADDLFLHATLPQGWVRSATDHAMHSEIHDGDGRKRVTVFYKAAFYDRAAHAHLLPRFAISSIYGESAGLLESQMAYVVLDREQEIFRTTVLAGSDYEGADRLRAEAMAWLQQRYPDYADSTAYW